MTIPSWKLDHEPGDRSPEALDIKASYTSGKLNKHMRDCKKLAHAINDAYPGSFFQYNAILQGKNRTWIIDTADDWMDAVVRLEVYLLAVIVYDSMNWTGFLFEDAVSIAYYLMTKYDGQSVDMAFWNFKRTWAKSTNLFRDILVQHGYLVRTQWGGDYKINPKTCGMHYSGAPSALVAECMI
jgi:hypothetical protein